MITEIHLKVRLFGLQLLVWSQRSLRLVLRAVWVGLGVFLLAWGCNALWGWLPNPRDWLLIGAFFASIFLALILFAYPRRKSLFWTIDRRLGLKEQISTAWGVVRSGETNSLETGLIADVRMLLPRLGLRIGMRGWSLWADVLSLVVVGGLAYAVITTVFITPPVYQIDHSLPAAALPPLGADPSAEQLFPDGLSALAPEKPAETSQPPGSDEAGGSAPKPEGPTTTQEPALTDVDYQFLTSALQKMGQALGQETATYEASQLLQSRDLDKASAAMEDLADQLSELPGESQEQLANQMATAAASLEPTSLDQLQDDMDKASSSLSQLSQREGGASDLEKIWTEEQFDQVAEDLRDISQQLKLAQKPPGSGDSSSEGTVGEGAGTAVGSRERGDPEDFSRMSGEGEQGFDLIDETGSALLGSGDQGGATAGSASQPGLTQADSSPVKSYIIPFYYPWKWRNVVSTYFERK